MKTNYSSFARTLSKQIYSLLPHCSKRFLSQGLLAFASLPAQLSSLELCHLPLPISPQGAHTGKPLAQVATLWELVLDSQNHSQPQQGAQTQRKDAGKTALLCPVSCLSSWHFKPFLLTFLFPDYLPAPKNCSNTTHCFVFHSQSRSRHFILPFPSFMKERSRMNNRIIYHPLPPLPGWLTVYGKHWSAGEIVLQLNRQYLKGHCLLSALLLIDFQERGSFVSQLMGMTSQTTAGR